MFLQIVEKPHLIAATRRCCRVDAFKDKAAASSASIDDAEMLQELQNVEVLEPVVEQKAESAALTVAAATAFGAGIWAVLGKAKAEGVCFVLYCCCSYYYEILN